MVPPLSQAGAILRTGAAESLWGDMRRNGLQPENLLTWLSLFGALLGTLGIACYVITWFGYQQFYLSFNVSSETVGISYPALLIPAAVFLSISGNGRVSATSRYRSMIPTCETSLRV